VGVVENQDARELGISVLLLPGAKEGFPEYFRTEMNRRKIEMDCF